MEFYRARLLSSIICFLVLVWSAALRADGPFCRQWNYTSETSAVIYWQLGDISSSATSFVEYGKTVKLGLKTEETRIPRWSHFHRLTGLDTGSTYYYRMVVIDPESGRRSESEILQLTPQRRPDAVRIPQDIAGGPPYILDRPDTYYILTRDITTDGTAIEIRGAGSTLDLDGHTVTFGNDTSEQVYGVRLVTEAPAVLCNGKIVQGRRSRDYSCAVASLKRPFPMEVFGIDTDVQLKCAYPIEVSAAAKAHIHHNHFFSRVTEIESRHYPGNALVLVAVSSEDGNVHIHDNLLTEGCHRGIEMRDSGPNVEVDHNDIHHHQQYVNGYAIIPSADSEVHHNKITSTGRAVHIKHEGIKFHDNYIDTQGHMHLSDLPEGTRPFHHRLIELHGIKLEGGGVRNCKVYGNFVRIAQKQPVDSGGRGDPADKVENGVYIRSRASAVESGRLVDNSQDWGKDRWRFYYLKYSPDLPPARIDSNDAHTLFAGLQKVEPGEYSVYMKWEYVPPTPLNLDFYDPEGMNEIYDNTFIGITTYRETRHGDYGDTGQWATSIMFVAMTRGSAAQGKYAAWVHDNRFMSNDLFFNSYHPVNMTVRVENNTFTLLKKPFTTVHQSRFRNIGPELEGKILGDSNTFNEE
ncbi:MAG TPA: right-handed parallel beta-helix repeat-containing protein [archaeon]|nr:right-handed parallel beta-helix repeat-containing protein [archaeon]